MEKNEKMSMHPTESVLIDFSFAEVHSYRGVRSIFRFEQMHNLCLGVSRTLQEYVWT